MAAFLANVDVNAGHAARSPLREDGTFDLIPIPEQAPWRPPTLSYSELTIAGVPARWHARAAHLDPDLAGPTPTYGDNCRHAGRAFSLRRAKPKDLIVFIARLNPPTFALVGCLVIDDVLADVTQEPGTGWWDRNAHVRRARAHSQWDAFWVFKGAEGTRRLERAEPFGRDQAERVFGTGWRWRPNRTELQTIGSYTRTIRRIDGDGETWLRTTCLS